MDSYSLIQKRKKAHNKLQAKKRAMKRANGLWVEYYDSDFYPRGARRTRVQFDASLARINQQEDGILQFDTRMPLEATSSSSNQNQNQNQTIVARNPSPYDVLFASDEDVEDDIQDEDTCTVEDPLPYMPQLPPNPIITKTWHYFGQTPPNCLPSVFLSLGFTKTQCNGLMATLENGLWNKIRAQWASNTAHEKESKEALTRLPSMRTFIRHILAIADYERRIELVRQTDVVNEAPIVYLQTCLSRRWDLCLRALCTMLRSAPQFESDILARVIFCMRKSLSPIQARAGFVLFCQHEEFSQHALTKAWKRSEKTKSHETDYEAPRCLSMGLYDQYEDDEDDNVAPGILDDYLARQLFQVEEDETEVANDKDLSEPSLEPTPDYTPLPIANATPSTTTPAINNILTPNASILENATESSTHTVTNAQIEPVAKVKPKRRTRGRTGVIKRIPVYRKHRTKRLVHPTTYSAEQRQRRVEEIALSDARWQTHIRDDGSMVRRRGHGRVRSEYGQFVKRLPVVDPVIALTNQVEEWSRRETHPQPKPQTIQDYESARAHTRSISWKLALESCRLKSQPEWMRFPDCDDLMYADRQVTQSAPVSPSFGFDLQTDLDLLNQHTWGTNNPIIGDEEDEEEEAQEEYCSEHNLERDLETQETREMGLETRSAESNFPKSNTRRVIINARTQRGIPIFELSRPIEGADNVTMTEARRPYASPDSGPTPPSPIPETPPNWAVDHCESDTWSGPREAEQHATFDPICTRDETSEECASQDSWPILTHPPTEYQPYDVRNPRISFRNKKRLPLP